MSNKPAMRTMTGLPTARGLVSGPVFIYRGDGEIPVPEYLVEAGREADELLRLSHARKEARRDLEGLVTVLTQRAGRDDVKVFESHLLILEDPLLVESTEKLIQSDRLNAEAAVRKVANEARETFSRMNDPYFRERVRDLEDVERRLLKILIGFATNPHLELKVPSIVVADDLTPSETVQLPREFVLGFAMNGGSTTSHVALLARAMGVPAVSGLLDVTAAATAGEMMLLDGTNGEVTLNPDAATLRQFQARIRHVRRLSAETVSAAPAGTLKDGGAIRIFANIHPGVPVGGVRELGARGIGLYRSEYLWLNCEGEPTEEEQFVAYREAVRFAMTLDDNASITIRALDIGGDKLVQGIAQSATARHEANPFLGNRSIRYLLSHEDVFLTQLRAILRASAFGRVRLLYPMVSCVEELRESARLLQMAKEALSAEHVPYDASMPVGAMIEVPSAALNADVFARCVDFFSIGTNDLIQYTMAADRGNESVSHLYQPLNPSILKLVRMTVDAARQNGLPLGVCGESASDPVVGVLWAAMGAEQLSVSATYIPGLARVFARLTRRDLDDYARFAANLSMDLTGAETYAECAAWLRAKVPDFDDALL